MLPFGSRSSPALSNAYVLCWVFIYIGHTWIGFRFTHRIDCCCLGHLGGTFRCLGSVQRVRRMIFGPNMDYYIGLTICHYYHHNHHKLLIIIITTTTICH